MTKREALNLFRNEILPSLTDRSSVTLRCAWNDYTDILFKNKEITEDQYNNWTNPFSF